MHSSCTMMNGMSLHPYPKGARTGCQISIPPFDMTSHPLTSLPDTLTSLPDTDTSQISAENVHVPDHIHDQKNVHRSTLTVQITSMITISKEVHVLPKLTVDDKASSKTHLVRLMHNVVTSKFKIFSVAKARC